MLEKLRAVKFYCESDCVKMNCGWMPYVKCALRKHLNYNSRRYSVTGPEKAIVLEQAFNLNKDGKIVTFKSEQEVLSIRHLKTDNLTERNQELFKKMKQICDNCCYSTKVRS